MAQTAGKFRSTNADLANMLQRLMSELETLRGSWRGMGAQAFDQARLRWDDDMRKLHQALDETANAIEKAGTYYTASDEASAHRLGASHGAGVQLPL
jgi:ESAT-6 family protein